MGMRLGAVVLASGESRRFEGGSKLLSPFLGKPLLAHTLAVVGNEFEKRLVVTRSEGIADLAASRGFEVLAHGLPDVSDTIRLGVSSMQQMDGCLFCVGDQPLLAIETVRRMVAVFLENPKSIVRACFGERVGNPVLFPRALFGELAALAVGQPGGTVVKRHEADVLRVQALSEQELMDVDTWEDYEKLIQKERENHAAHR